MPPRLRIHVAVRLALVAACMLLAGVAVYHFSARAGLAALRADTRHDLDLLATAVDGSVTRYEHLPSAVALSSEVLRLLRAGGAERDPLQPAANHYLEQLNSFFGGLAIFVLDTEGTVVASSDWIYSDNLLGQNQKLRAYFQAAVRGAPDRYYAIDETRSEAGYFFAQPIRDEGQDWRVVGVAVVKIGLADLERRWMPRDEPVLLADANGVVIVASVPDWKYTALRPLSGEVAAEIGATRRYGDHVIRAFPVTLGTAGAGQTTLVAFPEAPTLAGERRLKARDFLVETRLLPGIGSQLVTFADLRARRADALTDAALGAAATGCVLLLGLFLQQRRRTLKSRAEAQVLLQRANAELEQKVSLRTSDLTEANERLRAEVAERERAEQTLRAAQDELVQAAKLAVLGQLATGITHELTQPLGALRTLGGNAIEFMRRGDQATAQGNLEIMATLVDRMGEIIDPLKTYARKSPARPVSVDVAHALRSALFLLDQKLRRAGVTVDNRCEPGRALAWCDQNRLEQVLVNLIGNAVDAMGESPVRTLRLEAETAPSGRLLVRVIDSGPGLSDDALAHIFEPFFTTKPAGVGLGLGLAISQDIVRDFGGDLSAANHPAGGAVFTLDLPTAGEQQA
ncbi:sensor histidine kinase [Aromatoleum toluclasticum]|uniref:sensor histidine kinase n=1 Tax=Aromatoleum toluclasticum TaxID=92003 RepID=UPI001D18DDBD|nr:ATP-binding protein [Aromatoleum toluclasticum]MCC4118502.1 sensor histidine kinase [Aromatoleum toluclasticum]